MMISKINSKIEMKKNHERQGSPDTTALLDRTTFTGSAGGFDMIFKSDVWVRRNLIKFKKQLKKKCTTIDKLTDLLSRYDKQLTEKVRKFIRSLSPRWWVISQMSSVAGFWPNSQTIGNFLGKLSHFKISRFHNPYTGWILFYPYLAVEEVSFNNGST